MLFDVCFEERALAAGGNRGFSVQAASRLGSLARL